MAWPDTLPTRAALHTPVNNFATGLSGAITSTQTSIPLLSVTGLPTEGMICVEYEIITYTGISGLTLTGCTRGVDNTSSVPHASGARVEVRWVAKHHNDLADLLYQIQQVFGQDFLTVHGTTYATLKALLDSLTPLVVVRTGSTWTLTNDRGRLLSVQAWELTSPGNYTRLTPTSITQTSTTITVTFSGSKTGVLIAN